MIVHNVKQSYIILFKVLSKSTFFTIKKYNFNFYFPGSSFLFYIFESFTDITLGFWGSWKDKIFAIQKAVSFYFPGS
jgi:hypothetical protein